MIKIRPPRPEEIREIERLWVCSFRPEAEHVAGDKFVRIGKFSTAGIAPHAWRNAHRAYVQLRLTHDPVLVADLDGGLVGFIAFSLPDEERSVMTVHYLYVLREGRRKGIGRRLYEAAKTYAGEVPIRTTHVTRYWTRFVEGIA